MAQTPLMLVLALGINPRQDTDSLWAFAGELVVIGVVSRVSPVDLVLLIATVVALHGGATPRVEHGLAAVYLGYSAGFGHTTVGWADRWFAHLFAGAPLHPVRHEGSLTAVSGRNSMECTT